MTVGVCIECRGWPGCPDFSWASSHVFLNMSAHILGFQSIVYQSTVNLLAQEPWAGFAVARCPAGGGGGNRLLGMCFEDPPIKLVFLREGAWHKLWTWGVRPLMVGGGSPTKALSFSITATSLEKMDLFWMREWLDWKQETFHMAVFHPCNEWV